MTRWWGLIVWIGGAIAGITILVRDLLNIWKLRLEIREIQRKNEQESSMIYPPSSREFERYRRLFHRSSLLGLLVVAWSIGIAAWVFTIPHSTPQVPKRSNERIIFDLSSPVYGDCGEVRIYGAIGLSTDSQERITKVVWNWGDNLVSDGPPPAIHRYSKNGTYLVKATAQASNDQTKEQTIVINISNSVSLNCQ